MPDITMCKGEDCSVKEQCYRFTAHPTTDWQAYFIEVPGHDESCEYFLESKE
jgi:hypothetical protein